MAESVQYTAISALDGYRVALEAAESGTSVSANRRKAIEAFARFASDIPGITLDQVDDALLGQWASRMLYEGYTPGTISHYIKKIAALHRRAAASFGGAVPAAFGTLQTRLADEAALFTRPADAPSPRDTFAMLQRLSRSHYADPVQQLGADLLLYAVLAGGESTASLAALRRADAAPLGELPAIADILRRQSRPRTRYLFDLGQSRRTRSQQDRLAETLMGGAMHSVGIPSGTTPADLWAAAAMHSGISAADIAFCLGTSRASRCPLCALAAPSADLDDEAVGSIRLHVAETITSNPVRWYAMQFRPRVTMEQLQRRLEAEQITLTDIFYPMEEIVRKVGSRRVVEARPVVQGLLFFRERATALGPLYQRIGDLAWGYRQTRSPQSPYVTVSPEEIRAYQLAIGTFTPDTELHPAGTIPLRRGDRIRLIGGIFAGRTATFDSAIQIPPTDSGDTTTGRTIYRLLLIGDNAIEWAVDTDPRLVAPL